ncbi:minor capsid protein [Mycobacterium phage Oaker]|uniref:minor capsid protein n=1 Tax=Mycobacterium phage Oaker TaxID=1445727 RepID=UPI0003E3CB08|nr:minor capsid protein [Mycobacterium phage Oaker]AHG24405.1 minor capsid protein [Mycobacterium phage Oaker]
MALATKPRFEKSNPYGGTFVAPLAVDLVEADHGNQVVGVGLNSSGQVVIGAGQTGVIGVILPVVGSNILTGALLDAYSAGDVIDVMVQGEIINYKFANGNTPAAGTLIYSNSSGVLSATYAAGSTLIGWTIEAPSADGARLFVNVIRDTGALAAIAALDARVVALEEA